MRIQCPVFLDLAWECNRSPLIAAITALRLLLFVYVYYLASQVYDLFNTGLTCSLVRGAAPTTADVVTNAFLFISALLSALAANRGQSRAWLSPALLFTAIYAVLVLSTQAPSCFALMSASVGDADGIVTVVLSVFDAAFTLATFGALAMLVRDDPGAAIGRPAGPECSASAGSMSEVRASVERSRSIAAPGTGAFALWLTDVYRGALVAPLRHHLAVLLSVVFCLTVTIVSSILSASSREWQINSWGAFVDTYNEVAEAYNKQDSSAMSPIEFTFYNVVGQMLDVVYSAATSWGFTAIDGITDLMWSVTVGASVACVLVVVSVSMSYVHLYTDWVNLAAVKQPGELEPMLSEPIALQPMRSDGSILVATPGDLDDSGAAKESNSAAVPLLSPETLRAPTQSSNPFLRLLASCASRAPVYLPDGVTLDLRGGAFTYLLATKYSGLYMINLITVWALVSMMLTALVFYSTSRLTRAWAINTLITFVVAWVYSWIVGRLYACCVARGTRILHPRVFLFADLFFTITLGAAAGITSGVVRFVYGVIRLLFQMTILQKSLLPRAFATLDSGFEAYGGMVMAAWAAEIDPQSAPQLQ